MKKTFQRIQLFTLTAILFAILLTSCSKDGVSKPGNVPQTSIPEPFAGNWANNSVGLITYWNQGSYDGSAGSSVFTITLGGNGTAAVYGYYEGTYGSTFFYRYASSATYKQEDDNSVTITIYPYGGEQINGGGPKKPIGAGSLYPNNVLVLKNCTVYSENGKTYFSYYQLGDNGEMSSEPSILEKL